MFNHCLITDDPLAPIPGKEPLNPYYEALTSKPDAGLFKSKKKKKKN